MNATSLDLAAHIGAITPPSLWPTIPIFFASTSLRDFRNSTAASASSTKSSEVAVANDPDDFATPRSS